MDYPFMKLFDIPISSMTLAETADYLERAIVDRTNHQIVTINPIMIMEGLRNPEFRRVLMQAELNVPDGAGVVWAAKYVGKPVAERVPGIDLMHELLARSEKQGYRPFLLGADRETIVLAVTKLREKFPELELAGYHHGYFDESQDHEIIEMIRKAKPDLLFVGRSLLTQEPWIAKYKEELGVPVMMGVGGSFDVISGKLKRAPAAFQKMHLEWFYRLLQEPRRAGRMLALPRFMWQVVRNRQRL